MKRKILAVFLLFAISLGLAGCGHSHIFDERVADADYLKSKATCTDPAYYFHSCLCGEKGSTLFKVGAALGHSYGTDGICTACGIYEDEDMVFTLDKEKSTYTVTDYTGSKKTVAIPAAYLGLPVTAVSSSAFWNCSEMESISFPASVEKIPVSAFYRCVNIKSIAVAEGNKTYLAAGNCLIEKESGRLILGCSGSNLPSGIGITAVGSAAFKSTSLTCAIIPEGVTRIEDDAFAACSSLAWIVLPATLSVVDRWAFDACTALTAVYFGGTAEQWQTVTVAADNEALTAATFYLYSETAPDTEGNFWHYVEGVPAPW